MQALLSLAEHMRRNINSISISCPICGKKSNLNDLLQNCLASHLEDLSLVALSSVGSGDEAAKNVMASLDINTDQRRHHRAIAILNTSGAIQITLYINGINSWFNGREHR